MTQGSSGRIIHTGLGGGGGGGGGTSAVTDLGSAGSGGVTVVLTADVPASSPAPGKAIHMIVEGFCDTFTNPSTITDDAPKSGGPFSCYFDINPTAIIDPGEGSVVGKRPFWIIVLVLYPLPAGTTITIVGGTGIVDVDVRVVEGLDGGEFFPDAGAPMSGISNVIGVDTDAGSVDNEASIDDASYVAPFDGMLVGGATVSGIISGWVNGGGCGTNEVTVSSVLFVGQDLNDLKPYTYGLSGMWFKELDETLGANDFIDPTPPHPTNVFETFQHLVSKGAAIFASGDTVDFTTSYSLAQQLVESGDCAPFPTFPFEMGDAMQPLRAGLGPPRCQGGLIVADTFRVKPETEPST